MKHMRNGSSVRMALAALVGLGALAALPTGAKASLIGDPFTLTSQTGVGDFVDNAIVGAGIEFSGGDGSNFSNILAQFVTSNYFIDVDATSITFFWDFNHQFSFVFSDLNWTDMPGTITSVNAFKTSGVGNIGASVTTIDTVAVSFNCFADGGCGATPSFFRVDITAVHPPSAVPLPAALPLFLSALAGLGLMGWRRKQRGDA